MRNEPKASEEDMVLITGLFKYRDELKKELNSLPGRAKAIKSELRNLSDIDIAVKFDLSGMTIGRYHRHYKHNQEYKNAGNLPSMRNGGRENDRASKNPHSLAASKANG